jgi:excisionase family DNA binding protein
MDKEVAAKYLGISTRSLERYMAQGRIEVRYERSDKTRPKATFDKDELDRFKSELETPSFRPAVVAEDSATPRHDGSGNAVEADGADRGELRHTPPELAIVAEGADTTAIVGALVQAFEIVVERQRGTVSALPPDRKILLSLREAQVLTGLSRATLRQAIAENKLKAQVVGRGWKVKRTELEQYVEREF